MGNLPENRTFLANELKFINDVKQEASVEKQKKGGMQFCKKVIENTISFPSQSEKEQQEKEENEMKDEMKNENEKETKDESDSYSEEEEEDSLIPWTQENPLKRFYLSHLYIF